MRIPLPHRDTQFPVQEENNERDYVLQQRKVEEANFPRSILHPITVVSNVTDDQHERRQAEMRPPSHAYTGQWCYREDSDEYDAIADGDERKPDFGVLIQLWFGEPI